MNEAQSLENIIEYVFTTQKDSYIQHLKANVKDIYSHLYYDALYLFYKGESAAINDDVFDLLRGLLKNS